MRTAFLAACTLLLSSTALAQNLVMVHSGYLLDAEDKPLTASGVPLTFRIYNIRDLHGTGETLIWESAACDLAVTGGFYSVALGEGCNGVTPLSATHIPPGVVRYLEVTVNGTTLAPRLLLASVPNAATASVALEARGLTLSSGAAAGLALLSDANGVAAWGTVGSGGLTDGTIADVDVAAGAAIATSKLSGALTAIADNGLGALAAKTFVADADVAAGAAIATSKLSGSLTAISNHGLGALAAKTFVADADVAADAAIATSKLSGSLTAIANHGLGALAAKTLVADADVAAGAAIAGTKIAPNFGSQNVLTTGNVGIGTAASARPLDVSGTALSVGLTSPAGQTRVLMGNRDSTALPGIIASDNGNLRLGSGSSFAQTNGGTFSEALLVSSSGFVGIGTSAPAVRLDVAGGINAQWEKSGTLTKMAFAAPAFDMLSHIAPSCAVGTPHAAMGPINATSGHIDWTKVQFGAGLGAGGFGAQNGNTICGWFGKTCKSDVSLLSRLTPGGIVYSTTDYSCSKGWGAAWPGWEWYADGSTTWSPGGYWTTFACCQ